MADGHRRLALALSITAGALVATTPRIAHAWTFPEHVEMTQSGIGGLDPGSRQSLASLWAKAREGQESAKWNYRLCAAPAKDTPACVGLGSIAALAADHSCAPSSTIEPDNLGLLLATAKWLPEVLAKAHGFGDQLRATPESDIDARENIRRSTHIAFQSIDSAYLGRARVNGAHFQLARERSTSSSVQTGPLPPRGAYQGPDLPVYVEDSLKDGQDSNATALYAAYHLAALSLAKQAHQACRHEHSDSCRETAAHALIAEGFALHFLEDSFSSGHFIGTWGGETYRIGTHDAYSTHGVDARTWNGKFYPAHGDAFMRSDDRFLGGLAVRKSVGQLIDAFDGLLTDEVQAELGPLLADLENFDSCKEEKVPRSIDAVLRDTAGKDKPLKAVLVDVLKFEPIPSARDPELPRFRGEKGFFFGPATVFEVGYAWQDNKPGDPRAPGGVSLRARVGFRVGVGLGAIATNNMEDQAFLEGGIAAERYEGELEYKSHIGFYARFRGPYTYAPVIEPIIVLPFADAGKPWALAMLTRASSGGVLRWQQTIDLGRRWSVQVSILRDVSFVAFPNEPGPGNGRFTFTTSGITFRNRLPFAGAAYAVSSDLTFDLGAQIGYRHADLNDEYTFFAGPNATFSMGAKIFP